MSIKRRKHRHLEHQGVRTFKKNPKIKPKSQRISHKILKTSRSPGSWLTDGGCRLPDRTRNESAAPIHGRPHRTLVNRKAYLENAATHRSGENSAHNFTWGSTKCIVAWMVCWGCYDSPPPMRMRHPASTKNGGGYFVRAYIPNVTQGKCDFAERDALKEMDIQYNLNKDEGRGRG